MPDSALPTSMVLHPGEARVVELPGQGTGGYVWTAEVIAGDIGVEELPAEAADSDLLGAPATARFRLSAKYGGASHISFRLSRPWEQDAPASVHEMAVTVEP